MKSWTEFLNEATDPTAEAERKAAEAEKKAALEREKAAKEEEKRIKKEAEDAKKEEMQARQDRLRELQLKRAEKEAGISQPTAHDTGVSGAALASRRGGDITDKLIGYAGGYAYNLLRRGAANTAGGAIATAKQTPAALKATGRGVAGGYRAARTGAANVAGAGIATAKMGGRAIGLAASYDYAELMQSLSQLSESEICDLIEQLDENEMQIVENAIVMLEMGPGYNRLRTRLGLKFHAQSDPNFDEDATTTDVEPTPLERKHLRPWHQHKSVGPWGPKGSKAKRITLRSHRTGRLPKERRVPTIGEEAPANNVGGNNIAGINPPAGPAPLMSSQLHGIAAGKTIAQIAKHHGVSVKHIKQQLDMGAKVEREHTDSRATALKIAMDHVLEDPDYYTKLAKMEGDKKESYDIGNDTQFNKKGDRLAKYRIPMFQTRRTTTNTPGEQRL